MRCVVALVALALAAQALTDSQSWGLFKARYRRTYTASEEPRRFEIFRKNVKIAEQLTKEDGSATFGITKFSDLTQEEFIRKHTGLNTSSHSMWLSTLPSFPYTQKRMNHGIDRSDYVTSVKDQGSCGSCWAFSATAAAEACNPVKGKKLVNLSSQMILDCCDLSEGCTGGCNGGQEYDALEWAAAHDVATMESYPYRASQGNCKSGYKVGLPANQCTFYKVGKSEEEMVAVLEHTTSTVALDATMLQMYMGGVLKSCSGTSINHALLLVSDEAEGDAYKIKNSWGADWGEEGFFRMVKNKGCLGINLDYHSCVY